MAATSILRRFTESTLVNFQWICKQAVQQDKETESLRKMVFSSRLMNPFTGNTAPLFWSNNRWSTWISGSLTSQLRKSTENSSWLLVNSFGSYLPSQDKMVRKQGRDCCNRLSQPIFFHNTLFDQVILAADISEFSFEKHTLTLILIEESEKLAL